MLRLRDALGSYRLSGPQVRCFAVRGLSELRLPGCGKVLAPKVVKFEFLMGGS